MRAVQFEVMRAAIGVGVAEYAPKARDLDRAKAATGIKRIGDQVPFLSQGLATKELPRTINSGRREIATGRKAACSWPVASMSLINSRTAVEPRFR